MKSKFDTDFEDLQTLNQQVSDAAKVLAKLENELNSKCTDFLKKYSIENKIGIIDSLECLLKRGISCKQLVDLLRSPESVVGWG